MSKIFSKNVSLNLPVYQGGDLFVGALMSIEESCLDFSKIFISFNGRNSSDLTRFKEMQESGILKKEYITFITNADFDVVSHSNFVLNNLSRYLNENDLVFLLAHDDRLINNSSQIGFEALMKEDEEGSTVYIPSYSWCKSPNYNLVYKSAEMDKCISPEEFFKMSVRKVLATNMSGMIAPLHVLKKTQNEMEIAETGARWEYLVCVAEGVKRIRYTTNIKVLIGARDDSDGNSLTIENHRIAALNYTKVFFRNQKIRHPVTFVYFAYFYFRNKFAIWHMKLF